MPATTEAGAVCRKRPHGQEPTNEPPRANQQPRPLDAYEADVMRSFFETHGRGTVAIPEDYAAIASRCGAAANETAVSRFRLNSINWVAHFLQSGGFSLSTANLFAEVFDRYLSECAARKPPARRRESLARSLKDDACMVTFVLVLAKLCIAYNEDRSLRVSTADVLRYLPSGASRRPDPGEFRRASLDVLTATDYAFWPTGSPKRAFEVTLKRLVDARFRVGSGGASSVRGGKGEALAKLALPIYCRYLYDLIHMDYALMRRACEADLVAAALYLAALHWPVNYVACAAAKDGRPCARPRFRGADELSADPAAAEWCRGVCSAFYRSSLADMNAAAESVVRRLEADTRGTFYGDSKVAERYSREDAGRVARLGFPTHAFFRSHKMVALSFS